MAVTRSWASPFKKTANGKMASDIRHCSTSIWPLTGTERFHVQYRPIGKKATGGSAYLLSNPQGYIDNSTGIPDRYWFEGELSSIFSSWCRNQFAPLDWNLAVGVLPFELHNRLLMNDDVAGVMLSKNTIYLGSASNLNWQTFYFFDNVDAFTDGSSHVVGTNRRSTISDSSLRQPTPFGPTIDCPDVMHTTWHLAVPGSSARQRSLRG